MSILGLGNPPIFASGSGPCPDCPDCPDCPECPECPPDPKATAVNMLWGPAALGYWRESAAGLSGYALDDSNDAMAQVFVIPRSGTITKIGMYCTAVTGNPPAYNVGLVTISAATGFPSTSAYGGSALTTYDFTAAGWVWIDLPTPATAVAGEFAAVHIWPPASAPDSSNCASITHYQIVGGGLGGIPRGSNFSTIWHVADRGAWTAFAVQYSDGLVAGLPMDNCNTFAFDSADTPDEVGCRFTLPFAANSFGCRLFLSAVSASAPFTATLYDAAGNTLAVYTVSDEDEICGSGDYPVSIDCHWAVVALTANAVYRLAIKATSGTLTITPALASFESAASLTNNLTIPEAGRWMQTTRTDGGAWTDTNTGLVWMALWINSMTLPG